MQVLGDAGLAFEKRCRSATKSGLESRLESGQLVHLLRIRGKLWLSKLERDLEGGAGIQGGWASQSSRLESLVLQDPTEAMGRPIISRPLRNT